MAGIDGGGRAPVSEAEAPQNEDVFLRNAKQSGRLEMALEVKALLRGRAMTQEMPGARPLTPEEQAVWDLVEGFAQRMGATVDGK